MYIEFESRYPELLQTLVVHKLGLNVFLPTNPPEDNPKSRSAAVFLELLVTGINTNVEDYSLVLRAKSLFQDLTKDCEYVFNSSAWSSDSGDCSDMFVVSTENPAPPWNRNDQQWCKILNKETLYSDLAGRKETLLKKDDSDGLMYFDWDGIRLHPAEIHNDQKIHLRRCNSGSFCPTFSYDASHQDLPEDSGLALWVYWHEDLRDPYFQESPGLFEYPCRFNYAGAFKKISDNDPEALKINQFEVVITLPKGCRDDSDHNPVASASTSSSGSAEQGPSRTVSDWLEKKEKVHSQNRLFKLWEGLELENRRFIFFRTDKQEVIKGLSGCRIEARISDRRGDMQRQSDLTVASILVAAAAGIVFGEVPSLCFEALKTVSLWLMFCTYLLVLVVGFAYISYRVHGRRWVSVPANKSDCVAHRFKVCFQKLMEVYPRRFRSIGRLLAISLSLVVVFEYIALSGSGVRATCTPASKTKDDAGSRQASSQGDPAAKGEPALASSSVGGSK